MSLGKLGKLLQQLPPSLYCSLSLSLSFSSCLVVLLVIYCRQTTGGSIDLMTLTRLLLTPAPLSLLAAVAVRLYALFIDLSLQFLLYSRLCHGFPLPLSLSLCHAPWLCLSFF